MLACQLDSTRRTLRAEVLACEPADGELTSARAATRESQAKRAASSASEAGGFHVVLDDTVLYPGGGGQPADRGTIAGVRVRDVQRVGGRVLHLTDGPVPLGPAEVVVDWDRRRDHMEQHTGQHLLSAVALRHGWATTAFHLNPLDPDPMDGREPSGYAGFPASGSSVRRCDVELDVPSLEVHQVLALEEEVAAEIRAARPVRVREVERGRLEGLGVRTRGLPADVERVRLVEIEGVDLNTCGGTHLPDTGSIGALALVGTERVRGATRLYFVAGARVRALLGEQLTRADALNRALGAGPEGWLGAITSLQEEAKAGRKAEKALREELAGHLGRELAGDPTGLLRRPEPDLAFLGAIASAAQAAGATGPLLLTGGGPEGVFLAVGDQALLAGASAELLALLDGRGGGRPGRIQGKAARLDRALEAASLLRR